jgi:hypothetical protein
VSQTARGVKNRNTVIEPRVDIADDVAAINAAKAEQRGETFLINGRTYGLHGNSVAATEILDAVNNCPLKGGSLHLAPKG